MSLPPVHPVIVHLPIAFILLSAVADLAARCSRHESRRAVLRTLGFWCLVAGLATGFLTIAAGYLDLNRAALSSETRQLVGLHITLGWILLLSLIVLTAWRWLIWHRGQMTINTSYLVAAFLVMSLTLFQGWYGSEMVFSHGAGVAAAGQGMEDAADARNRLIAVHNLLQPGDLAIGAAESPGGTNVLSGSEAEAPIRTDQP